MFRRSPSVCLAVLVALAAGQSAIAKPADDPSFRLINRGNQTIIEFFATPAGLTNWGENRLSRGGLPAGTERLIHIPRTGNCIFDLRVVFADHRAVEKRHHDLCRISDMPVP